jgi:TetR/AcrR family acrAB operon transcriptional repressor
MARATIPKEPREALLDAADRIFQRFGYKKTTVEEIAAEAGFSRGTVYLHFRSKEEIALAWADRLGKDRRASLDLIAHSPGSPAERLRRMLLARVLQSFDRAQNYAQSLDELLAALRPALLAQREANHLAEADLFAQVIREGQIGQSLRPGDPGALARLLILATGSLMPYSLTARQLGKRNEVESAVTGLADLLLHGLSREVEEEG